MSSAARAVEYGKIIFYSDSLRSKRFKEKILNLYSTLSLQGGIAAARGELSLVLMACNIIVKWSHAQPD